MNEPEPVPLGSEAAMADPGVCPVHGAGAHRGSSRRLLVVVLLALAGALVLAVPALVAGVPDDGLSAAVTGGSGVATALVVMATVALVVVITHRLDAARNPTCDCGGR